MDDRSKALIALRSKWTQFGQSVVDSNTLSGKTADHENPQIFELGDVDPVEKNAKQYINELLATEAKITPVLRDPGLRKVQVEMEAQEAERKNQEAEKRKQQESKETKREGGESSGSTWLSRMQQKKKEDKPAARTKMVTDSMTGKMIEVDTTTLRIGGLHEITDSELRRLFGEANGLGGLAFIRMPKDENGRSRGFAYINYRTPEEAEGARAKMQGKVFKNIKLQIDFSAAAKK